MSKKRHLAHERGQQLLCLLCILSQSPCGPGQACLFRRLNATASLGVRLFCCAQRFLLCILSSCLFLLFRF